METVVHTIEQDIHTLALEAKNFPEGINETFMKLEKIISGFEGKDIYGVSGCIGDKVAYFACVKGMVETPNPTDELQPLTIPKGDYITVVLENWRERLHEMSSIFHELMQSPDFEPGSLCVEYYKNPHEALLMVKHK